MRKFFVFITAMLLILTVPSINVFAAPGINSVGGLGVNDYGGSSQSGCYGDRAGASLVTKLMGRFPYESVTRSFQYLNSDAYPSRFKSSSTVDLFIYSGHGVKKTSYNTPHFYASSATKTTHKGTDHSSTSTGSFEVDTTTVLFKHAYVAVYTCNWLNFDDNTRAVNQFKTFGSGCRLELGYGTTMYLDSREGNAFGYHMMDYVETVKDAFFNAATYYQSQSKSDVIVRVAGYKSAMSDTAYSGSTSTPPGYSGNNSQYEYYTKTVPGTGIII